MKCMLEVGWGFGHMRIGGQKLALNVECVTGGIGEL